jgi:hypothetical protein
VAGPAPEPAGAELVPLSELELELELELCAAESDDPEPDVSPVDDVSAFALSGFVVEDERCGELRLSFL